MMEAALKYEESLTLEDRILLSGMHIECGVDRVMGWSEAKRIGPMKTEGAAEE